MAKKNFGSCNNHRRLLLLLAVFSLLFLSACSMIDTPSITVHQSTELPSASSVATQVPKSDSHTEVASEPTLLPTYIPTLKSTEGQSKAEPTAAPDKSEPTATPSRSEPTKAPAQAKPTTEPVQAKTTLTPSINKSLNSHVDKILKQIITDDMSQVDQVRAVHDYIILNTAYYENDALRPEDYPNYVFTTEGVLKKGKAVCQGYAETFGLFMDRLGIECKFVVGKDLKNKVGHAWNMVSLNGAWYHVDTTWDDPIPDQKGRVQYKYFLVTDELMSKDHSWNQSNYPICDSTDFQYYIYEKEMIASIEDYEQKFIELYLSGERTITILYPEEGRPDLSFFFDYDYLHTVDSDGTKHMTYHHYPTWRLGAYTVYTVIVD